MLIAIRLLQELREGLENEAEELRQKLSNESWMETWDFWSRSGAWATTEQRDRYHKDMKEEILIHLKLVEDELLQVKKELSVIEKTR